MTWKLGTVVLTLALACLAVPNVEAGDGKSFTVRDVDGPTAFDFDGFVTVGTTLVPAASVGRVVADGRGRLNDGERRLVIGGVAQPIQTLTCTYNVRPNGIGDATCEIDETFDLRDRGTEERSLLHVHHAHDNLPRQNEAPALSQRTRIIATQAGVATIPTWVSESSRSRWC